MSEGSKPFFYERFVSLDNVRNIEGWWRFGLFQFSIGALFSSFLLGSLPQFFGFNPTFGAGQLLIAIYSCFGLGLLISSVGLLWLDGRYKVFKKRWMCPLFVGIYWLLSAAMGVVAYFTTSLVLHDDGSFSCKMNVAYYFLIMLPVFFGYYFFCYYAFLKFFAKFSKRRIAKYGEP